MFLILDINDVLVISNLPLSEPFLVEENTAIGTILYHVRVQDLDVNDNIQMYATSEPSIGLTYFNLTTGKVTFEVEIVCLYNFQSCNLKTYTYLQDINLDFQFGCKRHNSHAIKTYI